MKSHDKRALADCMTVARRDPEYSAHLDDLLKDRSWSSVAQTACYHVQIVALRLKPWQSPPCVLDEHERQNQWDLAGQKLLREMLALGLSCYEANPVAAVRAARKKCKATSG